MVNSPKLRIIPLGGIDEFGKNITVFEYDKDIIVVDCGLAFPDDDAVVIFEGGDIHSDLLQTAQRNNF